VVSRKGESIINYSLWLDKINQSNAKYVSLFEDGKPVPPIFFFGNTDGAIASTVGVNPSAGEFSFNRRWAGNSEIERLLCRCRDYFEEPLGIPPHHWFETWKEFLESIGLSYRRIPRAIHLDLSPRATRSMSAIQKNGKHLSDLFLDLIKNDIGYFFSQLRAYPMIRYLYAAGSITKKFYMIEFLLRYTYLHGCIFRPVKPFIRGGQGQIGLYKLDLRDKNPRYFFFCSTSPSARLTKTNPLVQKGAYLKANYPNFCLRFNLSAWS